MKDVHTEHCCIYHGCKYSYTKEICPVVTKAKVQSYPCEACSWAEEEYKELRNLEWFGMPNEIRKILSNLPKI